MKKSIFILAVCCHECFCVLILHELQAQMLCIDIGICVTMERRTNKDKLWCCVQTSLYQVDIVLKHKSKALD